MQDEITVKNVSKSYKNTMVLKNVNLNIKKGMSCGLIGENGSGKTILMKTICGFVNPDCGEIKVKGKIVGKDFDFPPDVGIIIENPGFSNYLSGIRNLENLASIRKCIDKGKVKEIMKLVGLNPYDKKWVCNYSLGMRQRLGIAQAIMENQDILILDEPLNGLDKKGVIDVRNILTSLKDKGVTMLISSHNTEDIDILCDEVYEMENGKIKRL
ncbi:MAG: ATP-binding cassette domain-containing protein [Lachnospiraceae bacterium]|nr:ATP-binding cassette domain-containing protein [Lachnospiraceae bacterium]